MRLIPVAELFAIVDDADYEWLSSFRWHKLVDLGPHCTKIYAQTWSGSRAGGQYRRHLTMQSMILNPPKGFVVDHRNDDGMDNRRSNIRIATGAQNNANRRVVLSASGFKGVTASHSRIKPWRANIKVLGRTICLGFHHRSEDAARAYDKAAREHYGEFAWTNFA